jgi:general secretion pathway protein G
MLTTKSGKKPRCRRFSLIEVMIVLIILASLAALVTPAFMNQLERAKRRTARIQLGNLANAAKDYYFDLSEYPKELDDLVQDPGNDKWDGPYLDPPTIPLDPWKNQYDYEMPGGEGRPFDISCTDKKGREIGHWHVDD